MHNETTAMNDTRGAVDWGPDCVVSVTAALEDAKDADSDSKFYKRARLALMALEEAITIQDVRNVIFKLPGVLRCYINSRLLDRIAFFFDFLSTAYQGSTDLSRGLSPGEMCAALGWMDAFQFFLRVEPECLKSRTASLARLYRRTDILSFLHTRGVDPIPVPFDTDTIHTTLIETGLVPRYPDVILSLENPNPSTPVTFTSTPSDFSVVVHDRHVFDPPFLLIACVYSNLTITGPLKVEWAYTKNRDRDALFKLCQSNAIQTLQCIGHRVYSFSSGVVHNSVIDDNDDGLALFRRITLQNRQGWKVDETELRRILH